LLQNIPYYLRSADDNPIGVINRGNGEARTDERPRVVDRNIDGLAVLSHSNGFEMINALTARYAGKNYFLLLNAIGREETQDRAADHLRGVIAEKLLGASVPAYDRAVQGLADDPFGGRVDNCL
jgi:hypothetical protein